MKLTLRIASLEWRGLFYSPIAWLVLVVFAIPMAITFIDLLTQFERSQYLGQALSAVTQDFFANPLTGFFTQVQSYLYLYIPLLTMGLMSREISSGSIKLLYSSPVRVWQILLGKFLAPMAYGLVLIAILGLFVAAAGFSIEAMDVKFTLSGLLGLYLLICAYSAIGLFMSCLTSYQVVAAVSTLVVLGVLNYIGQVGQQYDFVRDLTYFLSISGRSQEFIGGLISSKDVAYFVIVITMFLSLSVVKLQAEREPSQPLVNAGKYVGVLLAALMLGYLSSRPALWVFYDMTVNKDRSLTANGQAVIARMKGPLSITTYVNVLDEAAGAALPQRRNQDLKQLEPYVRFKPDLKMDYVYYYDATRPTYLAQSNPGLNGQQLAQKIAGALGLEMDTILPPEEIGKRVDLAPEDHRLVRRVEYDGRHSFIRFFSDRIFFPSESEVAAALKRLLVASPKVAFLTGHGERRLDRPADSDYQSVTQKVNYRYSLINQGFDVVTLDLSREPVPLDVTVLVIADPRQPLTAELPRIQEYIDRGGNVLLAADPGGETALSPVLEKLGLRYAPQPLTQESKDMPPEFVLGTVQPAGVFDAGSKVSLQPAIDYGSDVFAVPTVSLPGAMAITREGTSAFTAHPVVVASASGQPAPMPVAMALTRTVEGREQRLMVVGDADFMSNQELARRNVKASNLSFAMETFKWLGGGGEFPVETSRPASRDNAIILDKQGIFLWKMLCFGVLPLLIAVAGAMLLTMRRRR